MEDAASNLPELLCDESRSSSTDDTPKRKKARMNADEPEYWEALNSKTYLTGEIPKTTESPVGVVRGCPSCDRCQKVVARWRPDDGSVLDINEAPVFFPDEEEFVDAAKYIASIRGEAQGYGICRIVPPRSWRPSCSFISDNVSQNLQFATKVQQVHQLNNTKSFHNSNRNNSNINCPTMREGTAGPTYSLTEFKEYADEFKREYFKGKEESTLTVEEIEREYWRIVLNPTEGIEVLYGSDLNIKDIGSGFPESDGQYGSSGWNLNNTARQPGSVLAFEPENIPGITVPSVHYGMCLSSSCWNVENHFLYTINYLHYGDPKIWYGVPGSMASKFEEVLSGEGEGEGGVKLKQVSPEILQQSGLAVYKAVQRPKDFIVTFPRAYNCGINCGYNCTESVNYGPIDWLAYGQCAVEMYQKIQRPTSLSHDKLLLSATTRCLNNHRRKLDNDDAWHKIFTEGDQVKLLYEALKARVSIEQSRRAWLVDLVEMKKMDSSYEEDKQCLKCFYNLHLSAVTCECSPHSYACLEHTNLICQCAKKKSAYYRYDLQELHLFLTALEEVIGNVTGTAVSPATVTEHKPVTTPPCLPSRRRSTSYNTPPVSDRSRPFIPATTTSEPVGKIEATSDEMPYVILSDDDERPVEEGEEEEEEVEREEEEEDDDDELSHDVELLNIGRVVRGEGWCNQDAIFPAGYKSRVSYYNYLDLPRISYYVCEILDIVEKPYFKVAVEGNESDGFIKASIEDCWKQVEERVNIEIRRKSKIESTPRLKSVKNIDGLAMFGFKTPSIQRRIEALDRNHVCSEYWNVRKKIATPYDTLRRLFSKGDAKELTLLHQMFNAEWKGELWHLTFKALMSELQPLLENSTKLS